VFDLDRQTIYTSGALVRIRRVIAAIALEGMNPRSRTRCPITPRSSPQSPARTDR
jgi:hypothetical protein